MRIIIVIKLFDVFKARELNFLNGVISSAINFSLFKVLEKDLELYYKIDVEHFIDHFWVIIGLMRL